MATSIVAWVFAIPLLGVTNGLRTFTPMMVLCWYSYCGATELDGTWAAWTGQLPVALLFTALALGEYVGDKTPWIPNRTSGPSLAARMAMGGLVGAMAATSMYGSAVEGALLGAAGALVGTFGGFMLRRDAVAWLGCADWPVAVVEDALALSAAALAMHVVTG